MNLERIIEEKKVLYPDLKLIDVNKDLIIEQINKTKRRSHLDIITNSYCCYGVETCCWIDTISCWYGSLKELKKFMISAVNKINGNIYYSFKDGYHNYILIYFVDSGEMPIEYEFNKYDAKEFNILRMDPKNLVNFWDKDTFTKEDYYNKYLRYRRSEDTIIIKEIL
jgi:hypothetical protein